MRTRLTFLTLLLAAAPAAAGTVRLEADRDATMIESPDGTLANGAGTALFAGRTSQSENSIRRTLLHFDVAGALPAHAIVERVVLTLFMIPSNADLRLLRLHRVLADWGEGASSSGGGGGAAAQPGDVTWLHTFYDSEEWVRPGGQFVARASAMTGVSVSGYYTWGGTEQLGADVRLWAAAPERNFGWMLIGDEATRQSSKSFASREHTDAGLRPVLETTSRRPGNRRVVTDTRR
jgi:hypothetical protein